MHIRTGHSLAFKQGGPDHITQGCYSPLGTAGSIDKTAISLVVSPVEQHPMTRKTKQVELWPSAVQTEMPGTNRGNHLGNRDWCQRTALP